MDIYIANINPQLKEPELRKLVEVYGKVQEVNMIKDSFGMSTGTAFVMMPDPEEARSAVDGLNLSQVAKHTLLVNFSCREHQMDNTLKRMISFKEILNFENYKESITDLG